MEIGLREWLIVGAVIVILLIIIDGWRRMRAQSNSLKIDIDDKLADLGDDSFNPELPLGTARVFKPKENESRKKAVDAAKQNDLSDTTEPTHFKSEDNVAEPNEELHNGEEAIEEIVGFSASSNITKSESTVLAQDYDAPINLTQVSVSTDGDDLQDALFSQELHANEDLAEKKSQENTNEILSENPPLHASSSTQIEVNDQFLDNTQSDASQNSDLGFNALDPITSSTLSNDHQTSLVDTFAKAEASAKQEDFTDHAETFSEAITTRPIMNDTTPLEISGTGDDQVRGEPLYVEDDFIAKSDEQNSFTEESQFESHSNEVDDEAQAAEDAPNYEDAFSVPDILKKNVSRNTQYKTPARTIVGVTDQIDLEDDKKSFVSQTDDTDYIVSSLLNNRALTKNAENSSPGHESEMQAVEELAEIDEINSNHVDVLTTKNAEDDDSNFSEIEQLRARLKALAPDEFKESAQEKSDVIAQKNAESVEEDEIKEDEIKEDYQEFTTQQITTVIDDDVDLEDLDNELSKIESSLELEAQNSMQIEGQQYTNSVSAEALELEQQFEIEDREFVDAEKLQTDHDKFEIDDEFEMLDRKSEHLEITQPDPLMDDVEDAHVSQELIEQFENDLEEDTQFVSNELEMPITEMLKKKQSSSDGSPERSDPELTTDDLDDPLLDGIGLSEELLSSTDLDDDISVENEDESYNADNLGFTALEQGYQKADKEQLEERKQPAQQEGLFDKTSTDDEFKEPAEEVESKKVRKTLAKVEDPNSVLIVTVVAKEHYLDGEGLRKVVEACGMEFGDMDVFHRFEDGADEGAVQFSMANAVNPGTFDIANMDDSTTPGVSFFMSMDEPQDPKNALECMMATAETVANHLNGDLLDDYRSVLRPQTKEHYRERVREHEMNKLRQRAL